MDSSTNSEITVSISEPAAGVLAGSDGKPSSGAENTFPAFAPREHHLIVSRAARYFVLGTPSPLVRECWVVLHGYGQLAESFSRHFTGTVSSHRLVVAPEALSRFYVDSDVSAHARSRIGASWMTREDRLAEISDYVGFLDSVWARVGEGLDVASVNLGILGFSQGAATACRWAALGGSTVRRLVLWGGSVPDDLPLDRLRDRLGGTPLALVVGDSDRFSNATRLAAQMERLRENGVPATLTTFAGGHRIEAAVLDQVLDGFNAGSLLQHTDL